MNIIPRRGHMLKALYVVGAVLLFFISAYILLNRTSSSIIARPCISQLPQIHDLFPTTEGGVDDMVTATIARTQKFLDQICPIDDNLRTFDNTLVPFDRAYEELSITQSAMYILSVGSSDEKLRKAAEKGYSRLEEYAIDALLLNEKLFRATLAYQQRLETEKHESLSPERLYFLDKILKEFKRSGLQLSKEKQERVRALKKELSDLQIAFDTNISASRRTIEVSKDELKGLDDGFINSFKRSENGSYILTVDQSLVSRVLERCLVEKTRKNLYHAYMQRAYPENEKVLEQILAVSDELAKILGYTSSAQYTLENQMAKNSERVDEFLDVMLKRAYPKAQKELELFLKDLPPSVTLKDGKIQPWDVPLVYEWYKRKHFQVDETKIAEYFPLDYTLPALLKVYEEFFGICFTNMKKIHLWYDDLQAYAVYKKGHYRGMIILDLFPRPHKYTHAGYVRIVPALEEPDGRILPGVGVLFLNFTASMPGQPTLLKRSEVRTFFHEFGHAIHSLLGATEFATTSGTATKQDFVEMPSQMLEQWLWDPQILKAVSSHVTTKEPLPDEIIKNCIASKHVGTGDSMLRQISFARLSLDYYLGGQKPVEALWRSVTERIRPYIVSDPLNKGYCSFVHLSGYGPNYYGYLWSEVFALDLFAQIKQHGLRNPEIGAKYVNEVLSKGGGTDPEELLRTFLGREPSTDAFFKDLGL